MQATRVDRWSPVRRELQHRRSRLIRSVHQRVGGRDAETLGAIEAEHLVVYEQRQLEATLDAMQRAELDQIEAALERLTDGTYGTCTSCGDAIHPERLEAVPTSAVCTGCAG